jgi:hypothetical protein
VALLAALVALDQGQQVVPVRVRPARQRPDALQERGAEAFGLEVLAPLLLVELRVVAVSHRVVGVMDADELDHVVAVHLGGRMEQPQVRGVVEPPLAQLEDQRVIALAPPRLRVILRHVEAAVLLGDPVHVPDLDLLVIEAGARKVLPPCRFQAGDDRVHVGAGLLEVVALDPRLFAGGRGQRPRRIKRVPAMGTIRAAHANAAILRSFTTGENKASGVKSARSNYEFPQTPPRAESLWMAR